MSKSSDVHKQNRKQEFRKLITTISECLTPDDLAACCFLQELPKDRTFTALEALDCLMQRDFFSHSNVKPLIGLMRDIKRKDLVSLVNSYEGNQQLERCRSLPIQSSENTPILKRSNTETAITITVTEESKLPSVQEVPQQDNEHLSLPTHGATPAQDEQMIPPQNPLGVNTPGGSGEVVQRKNSHETVTMPEASGMTRRESDSKLYCNITVNNYHMTPPATPARSGSTTPANTGAQSLTPRSSIGEPSMLSGSISAERFATTLGKRLEEGEKMEEDDRDSADSAHETTEPPCESSHATPDHESSPKIDRLKGKWSIQPKWILSRKDLFEPIYEQQISSIKYPQQIPLDIDSHDHNPYLSLFLYPFGLFDDRNKNMTLMVKVTIPETCLPIPSKALFELRWGLSIKTEGGSKTLAGDSKKVIKIKFKAGVKYIYNILRHKILLQNKSETLELHLHISTSYSINSTYNSEKGTFL